MNLVITFVPLIIIIFVVLLAAAAVGFLSTTERCRYWAEHPWRFFWLSYLGLIPSMFLWSSSRSAALLLFVFSSLLAYASVIQGLRMSWKRSHRRAAFILLFGFVVLALPQLAQYPFGMRPEIVILNSVVVVLLWVAAARIAARSAEHRLTRMSLVPRNSR